MSVEDLIYLVNVSVLLGNGDTKLTPDNREKLYRKFKYYFGNVKPRGKKRNANACRHHKKRHQKCPYFCKHRNLSIKRD